jgi:hypothetical protein
MCNLFFQRFRVAGAGWGRYGCAAMTRQSIQNAIIVFLVALVLTFLWTCWRTLQLLGIF